MTWEDTAAGWPHGSQAAAEPGAGTAALVDHILVRFHQRHRRQLPELIRLARKVEQMHGERPECPAGLAEHLCAMQQQLESHMQKEEQVLFPLLVRGGAESQAPIAVMRMEHGQHRAGLGRLAELAHGLTLPADACGTWRELHAALRVFRDDLAEHMRLEDDVLFARGQG